MKFEQSKWTAKEPQNKEKHFIVIKVYRNLDDRQIIDKIDIQAVYTNKIYQVTPKELLDKNDWTRGWKSIGQIRG